MIDINLLNKTLNFTKDESIVGLSEENMSEFTEDENEYLREVFRRLEKDGYVRESYKSQYVISFDGLMALQERYLCMFQNKPYKRAQFERHINNAWQVVKIIAAVLNAVILILLGWLALFKQ